VTRDQPQPGYFLNKKKEPGNEVDFSFVKIFLTKLWCYHDNYFKYFMFGKYNGFACMYFLVDE
jgi:hypothetical protein